MELTTVCTSTTTGELGGLTESGVVGMEDSPEDGLHGSKWQEKDESTLWSSGSMAPSNRLMSMKLEKKGSSNGLNRGFITLVVQVSVDVVLGIKSRQESE